MTVKFAIHYGLHFILPLLVSFIFYRSNWKKTYFLFIACFLVDLDHLLAYPIFAENRCSINYHPLHSYYAIAVYLILLIPSKTRLIALGLILHMIADQTDCWMI